jgi:hypothetical protein
MMGDRMMYGRPTGGLVNHIVHHTSVHASLCVSYSNTEDLNNSDVEGFRFPRLSGGRFPVPRPEFKSDPPDGARAAVDGRDKEEERDVAGT